MQLRKEAESNTCRLSELQSTNVDLYCRVSKVRAINEGLRDAEQVREECE